MSPTSALQYDRKHPLMCTVKQRFRLNPGSKKETYHIVLDISGSDFTYQVGDSIGIFPKNDPQLVNLTLEAARCLGTEIVEDKRKGDALPLRTYLSQRANISNFSKKALKKLAETKPSQEVTDLLTPDNKEKLKNFLTQHQWWDALENLCSPHWAPQDLIDTMQPLIPRLYSIASSPKVTKEEIHLTVALTEYKTRDIQRYGVCTRYLCHLVPEKKEALPIYLQPTKDFRLPNDPNTPIIMIGPGTGIAPFRAFMQERLYHNAKGQNWLFFGDWSRAYDYYYGEYWDKLVEAGHLRLDLAFSRDQDHKVYVQHRMEKHAQELWQWIQKGAITYVCGDAHYMAKDVDSTLLRIAQTEGNLSEKGAKGFIKELRKTGRYVRDVY